ncbi:hypothetical protein [Sporomusa acidovorans]|uniref:Uncharacterized protein n=1 Tax=Sporomusa acidovorans (strain ATCC 49682 / DSM 3132 / Mol) TaxID=1123286 RepID=A0ABZ3J4W7_SPOA4|nr:hypothetical protein [Sporomusa acidovorans]OZC19509.1 hypothetical protein SPACI_28340 [Sporomusa acidovorans DSM 3132]SDF75448.1 hypothetical protein SAMN04488499_107719 [Sporomusa acidovorans]
MMLKTVYGPPPANAERIEAAEPEGENCICEETSKNGSVKPEKHFVKEHDNRLQLSGTSRG